MDERFARHTLIPGWEQQRLTGARVVIIGLGALGNEAARTLAMAGVGQLILCDFDRVEASNLSRCCLFRGTDTGRLKVEAAARALAELNPGTRCDPRPRPLVHGVGLAELRDASLVLSCLDSRAARLDLAGRCGMVRAPWIDAGTHAWGGEVRPYLNPDGPCFGCALTPAQRAVTDMPWSCVEAPASGPEAAAIPSSALVGAWMGLVAVRFLLGLGQPASTLRIDGPRAHIAHVVQTRDPGCPLHEPVGMVHPVPIAADDPVGRLREILGPGDRPLAWGPVQCALRCGGCGFAQKRWGMPVTAACPRCGTALIPKTTLELADAPADAILADLGIAPREILAVAAGTGMQWIELSSDGAGDPE